ncbi:hypothetical protein P4O61_RS23740, partial [Escherichia coli]
SIESGSISCPGSGRTSISMDAIVARQDNHHKTSQTERWPPCFLSIWRSVAAYALMSNALVGLSTDATSQEKIGADRKNNR